MPTEREMGERRHAFVRLGALDYCWHWISGAESDPYGGRYCRQNKAHPVHGLPPDAEVHREAEPETPKVLGYTPYFEVEAAGQRIGLMTCLQCGAAVLIGDKDFDAARAHGAWHANRQI